jgi:hypothetical protein
VKTKFEALFEETFLSARQQQQSVPPDEVDAVQPDSSPDVSVVAVPGPTMADASDVPSSIGSPENVPGNLEDEAEEDNMAKANLFALYSDAKEVHNLIQGGFHPEAWMIQKIAVCADNLAAVLKAARYESAAHVSCGHEGI